MTSTRTSTTARVLVAATALTIGASLAACSAQSTDEAAAGTPTTTTVAAATTTESPAQAEQRRQSEAAAEKARQEQEARRQAEEAAKQDPSTYEQLSDRDFALITKNPAAAIGRKVIVYGRVTQFDSATGTGRFLARTGASPSDDGYDYDQNTMVVGDTPALIADTVKGDLVTMYAKVLGSFSYDTQAGGNTTVPQLQVNIIERTGSV
ncbi:DUF2510 domain-containing protein [Rhodococcus sp. D2-41]|uniref:DUF2510 domain-containing protein n=1 Tax=Speluncibacter jeojiensis TaxID=2710754 RepID=UPI00240F472A|nr:DUF2510 domain-containing protein [Rhodococcus sp. D2-41]MDG3012284.1 DUF2510 domain-containing protein [Rhodococcus sp. D2-41]